MAKRTAALALLLALMLGRKPKQTSPDGDPEADVERPR